MRHRDLSEFYNGIGRDQKSSVRVVSKRRPSITVGVFRAPAAALMATLGLKRMDVVRQAIPGWENRLLRLEDRKRPTPSYVCQ